tara:strand:- start:2270 stop:3724 length:1455 start_codon:yes stop_codon:yes gene_type:complete
MTNKVDNLEARARNLGAGQEDTVGVPRDGFSDPSGEFPKRDYFFSSSVNKAAKGEKVNNLDIGGGDLDISIDMPSQKPSMFPHNDTNETPSGHVIEYDDTPGGERILLKHRTGAGVEMRADGTVVVVSKNKRIEVTGSDHTAIIEGDGDLIYKGSLNLRVSGDYNLDVGGDFKVNVAGDIKESIKGRHNKTVGKDQNYTIRGSRGSQVVGMNTETLLGSSNVLVKGDQKNYVEGDIEMLSSNTITQTAVKEWVVASSVAGISARHISVIGHKGTIGGSTIDYYGKTYGGMPGGVTNLATFYGTLVGKATEANHADYAIKSSIAEYASGAAKSLVAAKEKPTTISPPSPIPGIMTYLPLAPTAPLPNPAIVEMQLSTSNYGIRNVEVDPLLKEKISRSDDYKGLFNEDPSIHEIRSKLRDTAHFNNNAFTSFLVSENKLNKDFKKNIPRNIGRSANKKGTIHFGTTTLGNNPADTRSKRFKVNTK